MNRDIKACIAGHPVLAFFDFRHLPDHLQSVVGPISDLAFQMAETYPDSPQTIIGLQKLLEAKDCFVRAAL